MFFYAFKMAVAIVFLCENAVEAIQISFISLILILNGFYSISRGILQSQLCKRQLFRQKFNC
jgi:hypothetical protein